MRQNFASPLLPSCAIESLPEGKKPLLEGNEKSTIPCDRIPPAPDRNFLCGRALMQLLRDTPVTRPAPSTRASSTPIQDARANEIFAGHRAAWMDAERRLQVHAVAGDEAASLRARLADAEAAPRILRASHSTRLKTKAESLIEMLRKPRSLSLRARPAAVVAAE
ncbi:uncharacterized protein [Miscanthus floridulus]|uniref:uncharacterized protein n=1 Tax=Miscanthus floridulus TaxID=154761 RepID=UPI003459FFA0